MTRMSSAALATLVVTALGSMQASAACPPPADVWQQEIEEQFPSTYRTNARASYYYTATHFCDNEADLDYIFVFRLNYSCNPDSLKWYSEHTQTRWVLPATLNSRSPVATDDDVHVCMGENSLALIGNGSVSTGINYIWNYFYLFTP